jgi:DNA-binding response OmpR family regulator
MALNSTKNILIVDDDEMIREYVKEVLLFNDFKVDQAENGKQGMKKVFKNMPDLVITDIIMPEMEGISFIRELRSYNKNLPIVAMTSNINGRMEEFLELSSQLGADSILRKPIKSNELLEAINNLI